jgi:hypothetical protein
MEKAVGIYNAIAGIDDRDIRGHTAALLFRAEAAARGFVPTTPEWNIPIDHILISRRDPRYLVRVEVKQSRQIRKRKHGGDCFTVELRTSQGIGGSTGSKKGKQRLHKYERAVDVFAILPAGTNQWYLIPEKSLRGKSSVSLCPEDDNSPFHEFRGNWAILEKAEVRPPRRKSLKKRTSR